MALFDKAGIRFQYPENWTLDESDALGGQRSVALYTPGGGFWSVIIHPPGEHIERLLDTAVKAMRKEYKELDVEPVIENLGDVQLEGYDLNFYCLDLTNSALLRVAQSSDATLLIMYQAEDREFDAIGKVFQAITISLLRESTVTY